MTNVERVRGLIEAFNRRDIDAVMGHFTEDSIYHNMPGPPMKGLTAIRKTIESFVGPAETVDWETLAIAEQGDTVLTERMDRFVVNGKSVELPVMGAFEFRGGKIVAWRDYFDLATWQRQMGN